MFIQENAFESAKRRPFCLGLNELMEDKDLFA